MRLDAYLLIALALAVGCSGDDNPTAPNETGPSVRGEWEVDEVDPASAVDPAKAAGPIARTLLAGHSFVSIDDGTLAVINQRGLGFRSEAVVEYITGDNLLNAGRESFTMELSEDVLILQSVDGRFVFQRREQIPDVENWIVDYESEITIETRDELRGDLAWDGEALWVSGGPKGIPLTRVEPGIGTGTIRQTRCRYEEEIPSAIEIHGGFLFGNDRSGAELLLYDHALGRTSDPIAEIDRRITMIVSDGNILMCSSKDSGKLHLYDPSANRTIHTIDYGEGFSIGGGTHHDGIFYLAAGGVVTLFEPLVVGDSVFHTLSSIGALQLPGHSILGVAHDGEALWVNALDRDGGATKLHRIRPASEEL